MSRLIAGLLAAGGILWFIWLFIWVVPLGGIGGLLVFIPGVACWIFWLSETLPSRPIRLSSICWLLSGLLNAGYLAYFSLWGAWNWIASFWWASSAILSLAICVATRRSGPPGSDLTSR